MSRKTRRSRRGPVLVVVTLILAAGVLFLWNRPSDTAPAAADTTPSPTSTPTSPPSDPASSKAEPSQPADEVVEKPSDNTPQTPSPPVPTAPLEEVESGGLATVSVSLTYAGYDPTAGAVVAGGYATDVVEVDATCTLVLRRDGVELRGESLGTPSATTTDCGEVRVGGDALTSGTWEAVLGYTSETSAGESAPVEVEVP
jgi:hypothetical protein